jgi:hypothetical protein
MTITRRRFLMSSAGGLAAVTLAPRPLEAEQAVIDEIEDLHAAELGRRFPGLAPGRFVAFAVRFRTDPGRLARALPPPLEPPDDPQVQLNFYVSFTADGQYTPLSAGPTYGESDVMIAARFRGAEGMIWHVLYLPRDAGRLWGREKDLFHKREGVVVVERRGDRVRASTTRRGLLLHGVEAVLTDEPAHPLLWFREPGWGLFNFSCRLHPDWRQGPLRPEPLQLWRLPSGGAQLASDLGFPTGMPDPAFVEEHPGVVPRACDPAQTRVEVGDPSPLNPLSELPVREVLGASWSDQSLAASGASITRVPVPRGPDRRPVVGPPFPRQLLAEIEPAEFQQWAHEYQAYDRPISRGRVWVPAGWPESATAFKLAGDEVDRYRSRETLELDPVEVLALELELEPSLHARTLPPQCPPGGRPLLRILALDVGRSDLSTRPFVELWLMTRCELATGPAWYALSHIVGWDGDAIYGRETFGYPSKLGEPKMAFDGGRYQVLGRRMRRTFFRCDAPLGLDRPQRREESLEVIGIQLLPHLDPPRADLLAQPWTLALEKVRRIDLDHLVLDFPDAPGRGRIGLSDPWCELASGRPVAGWAGRGVVRRYPCRILGDLPGFLDYYAERLDGGSAYNADNATFLEPKASQRMIEVFGRRAGAGS